MNKGLETQKIAEFQLQLKAANQSYLPIDPADNSDEYFHFQFIGKHQGVAVLYDAVLTTLRLEHESELYEIAEQQAAEQFPQFKKIDFEELTGKDHEEYSMLEEEIGLYMAEVILGLQDDEAVKVKEHLEIDLEVDFGVGLDVGLNVELITPLVIEKFITEFNGGTLRLDETLYCFETEQEDSEEIE
jgi:hypothetical protein